MFSKNNDNNKSWRQHRRTQINCGAFLKWAFHVTKTEEWKMYLIGEQNVGDLHPEVWTVPAELSSFCRPVHRMEVRPAPCRSSRNLRWPRGDGGSRCATSSCRRQWSQRRTRSVPATKKCCVIVILKTTQKVSYFSFKVYGSNLTNITTTLLLVD